MNDDTALNATLNAADLRLPHESGDEDDDDDVLAASRQVTDEIQELRAELQRGKLAVAEARRKKRDSLSASTSHQSHQSPLSHHTTPQPHSTTPTLLQQSNNSLSSSPAPPPHLPPPPQPHQPLHQPPHQPTHQPLHYSPYTRSSNYIPLGDSLHPRSPQTSTNALNPDPSRMHMVEGEVYDLPLPNESPPRIPLMGRSNSAAHTDNSQVLKARKALAKRINNENRSNNTQTSSDESDGDSHSFASSSSHPRAQARPQTINVTTRKSSRRHQRKYTQHRSPPPPPPDPEILNNLQQTLHRLQTSLKASGEKGCSATQSINPTATLF